MIVLTFCMHSFLLSKFPVATVHIPTLVRTICIIMELGVNMNISPRVLLLLEPHCNKMEMVLYESIWLLKNWTIG